MMASLPGKVDRQTTTPFLLKLFYKEGAFTPLSDFHSSPSLPPHIALYAWQTSTLREIAHLLSDSHPELLPTPSIGTRLAFRLVFPDTRSAAAAAAAGGPNSFSSSAPPGRFLHHDLGSVVLGDDGPGMLPADWNGEEGRPLAGGSRAGAGGGAVEQADVMLKDARFVIGDYIAVAILPPLGNGNVAAVPGPGQSAGMGGVARGGRALEAGRDHHHQQQQQQQHGFGGGLGKGGSARENGFWMAGGRGRGRGAGGWAGAPGSGGPRGVALPSGEWRRGERLPDGPPGGGGGGRGGYGGGRGRDRW